MNQERRWHLARLTGLVAGMFAFGYALVPLYGLVCDITGLNGKTDGIQLSEEVVEAPDENRLVEVQFLTTVNNNLNWRFGSETNSIKVHPGKLYTVNFFAENPYERDFIAQATPSVVPWNAAKYIRKTECFCFSQQTLQAGEHKNMPVRFMLDPSIPDEVDTITLSYTLFDATGLAQAKQ
ncbi:MAG: cytochrome c oxidase assembly protein [Oceanococcus sp.]